MKLTDKEKKDKIADILLDFYDEYHSNEINRPMIPSIYAGKILDYLKTKEVDLNEEIKSYFKGFGKFASVGIDDRIDIAKYFFELGLKSGLKTQKWEMETLKL